MNDREPADLALSNWSGVEVLCDFSVGGHDCWLVAGEVGEDAFAASADFVALCHLRLDGRTLTIIQRSRRTENTRAGDQISRLLTARELQIATLVAMGCPNKQVADKLRISEWTVATYLRRVYSKLGVDSRAAMTFRCASLIGKQKISGDAAGGLGR